MDKKLLSKLQFDEILAAISENANTKTAKAMILATEPSVSLYRIQTAAALLQEALNVLSIKSSPPLGGYKEITAFAEHTEKGGIIRQGALLSIAKAIRHFNQLRRFIFSAELDGDAPLLLRELADEIQPLSELEHEISDAVLSEEELADSASSLLYDIRRKIRSANASVKDKLNGMISGQNKKYLQDAIITMRNGRYVIPVRSEYKSAVSGIIHDTSSSGLTVFIEPQAVVNLNNELRQLESEEKKEIERILEELSKRVSAESFYLKNNERILMEFDECFAKAKYAYDNEHTRPVFETDKTIDLKKAYHPLLDKKTAVASDITIGEDYLQVIITGPNTGGKTVSLKTVGLCVLMAQSGLFIPAAEGSRLSIFEDVFADIGDEQSIAQSLSTFSAHMKNIVYILEHINKNSLVLLDELGAGTDPTEGEALARAILIYILSQNAFCIATTHYNAIKRYALTQPRVINASVEFDTVRLRPTYRLQIGLPGKSNAFEISKRIGLSKNIIDDARNYLKEDESNFEDTIAMLQTKLSQADEAARNARKTQLENESLNELLKKENIQFNDKKDKLITNASLEAKRIINEAKQTAKEMISKAENSASAQAHSDISLLAKNALDKANKNIPQHVLLKQSEVKTVQTFKKNDSVFIPELNSEAVILDIDKNTALVQVGMIKTKIPLVKLEKAKKKRDKQYSYTGMKALGASSKLDIRGLTSTEVSLEVEKFLDDASLAGLKTVTIVHGKGEGVLRNEVTKVLKHHPLVSKFRLGGLSEGSGGATIVELI